jgi:gluconate kinase
LLLAERLMARRSHFFDQTLLRSQFADLEEPQPHEDVVMVDVHRSPTELVEEIKARFRLQSSGFTSKEQL